MIPTDEAVALLEAQVAQTETVEASAKVLIEGLAQRLADIPAGSDPNLIIGLADRLRASADALTAAIVANTPAAPAAPDVPPGA